MHETYWGPQESPFRHSAEPCHFFASPTHREALARTGAEPRRVAPVVAREQRAEEKLP